MKTVASLAAALIVIVGHSSPASASSFVDPNGETYSCTVTESKGPWWRSKWSVGTKISIYRTKTTVRIGTTNFKFISEKYEDDGKHLWTMRAYYRSDENFNISMIDAYDGSKPFGKMMSFRFIQDINGTIHHGICQPTH